MTKFKWRFACQNDSSPIKKPMHIFNMSIIYKQSLQNLLKTVREGDYTKYIPYNAKIA